MSTVVADNDFQSLLSIVGREMIFYCSSNTINSLIKSGLIGRTKNEIEEILPHIIRMSLYSSINDLKCKYNSIISETTNCRLNVLNITVNVQENHNKNKLNQLTANKVYDKINRLSPDFVRKYNRNNGHDKKRRKHIEFSVGHQEIAVLGYILMQKYASEWNGIFEQKHLQNMKAKNDMNCSEIEYKFDYIQILEFWYELFMQNDIANLMNKTSAKPKVTAFGLGPHILPYASTINNNKAKLEWITDSAKDLRKFKESSNRFSAEKVLIPGFVNIKKWHHIEMRNKNINSYFGVLYNSHYGQSILSDNKGKKWQLKVVEYTTTAE